MTEEEWLKCAAPTLMLESLREMTSDRKLLLFSCAGAQRISDLRQTFLFESLDLISRSADGLAGEDELDAALKEGPHDNTVGVVAAWVKRDHVYDMTAFAADWVDAHWKDNWPDLMREVFGNPFRSISINPTWLTPTVITLATVAYEQRALPSGELDTARLTILADALEDAGCENQEILGHLRSQGPHVRGCWAVDLLLGKE